MVQLISSIDEGVELAIVADGNNMKDFTEAVNSGTARIIFDDCADFRKTESVLDLFKYHYSEFLEEEHELDFENGLTVIMMNKIMESHSFVDGDSRSRLQFFSF